VKKRFGVLAAVLLALVVLAPPAEARCWWGGYRWHCTHYRHHYYSRHWHPYRYYGYYPYPYYQRAYYRPYYYRPYYAYACVFPFCW
jgi:hypothetical protein